MDGQDNPKTANEIYNWVRSSGDNRLKFIIVTHYNQVLARAQSAGLVRGNVGADDLFTAVKAASVSPAVFAQVLNIVPDTSKMTEEAAEAWNMLVPVAAPVSSQSKVAFNQQAPYYCAPGFTGPIPPNAPACPQASGEGFFQSDTFNTILETLPDFGNAIACWINPERCQANRPPVVVTNPTGPSDNGNDQKTNYVPWIIGGSVAVVFIGVILFIVLRKK